MAKVAVIIPAAGVGKRFGGDVKKPFAQLDNRPIFIRSIELFLNRPDVCQVILAVGPDDYDVVKDKYAAQVMFMGLKLVKGGAERFESVRLALEHVDAQADLICVHDAVRPCVLENWIDAVFAEAVKAGAAILAAPVTGTLKRVAQSKVIDETISRENLYEAQTPQVFRKDILLKAYERLGEIKEEPTDDAQLVELAGEPVSVVISDLSNLKVTTKGDITLANAILKSRPAKPVKRLGAFEEAQW